MIHGNAMVHNGYIIRDIYNRKVITWNFIRA